MTAIAAAAVERAALDCEVGVCCGECGLVGRWFRILLLYFAIDEKVVQNSTWTPDHPICPSLDAGLDLVEYKDGATLDQLALIVAKTSCDFGQDAAPHRLKDEQSISSRVAVETSEEEMDDRRRKKIVVSAKQCNRKQN